MIIQIDTRESNPDVFGEFAKLSIQKEFDIEKKTLEVGDFAVDGKDIIIERKSCDDFISSIKDGRLSEQAMKMNKNYGKCYFIVEGNLYGITDEDINLNCIYGAFTSLAEKYNCFIIPTKDIPGTIFTAWSIFNKFGSEIDYKKELILPKVPDEDVVPSMLTVLPNISLERAKQICKEFKINGFHDLNKINNANFNILREKCELKGIGDGIIQGILKFC